MFARCQIAIDSNDEPLGVGIEFVRRRHLVDETSGDVELCGIEHEYIGRRRHGDRDLDRPFERRFGEIRLECDVVANRRGGPGQAVLVEFFHPRERIENRSPGCPEPVAWFVVSGHQQRTGADARYDVVGIGNALVDVIAHAGDDFLNHHELVKGSMTLVETERAVELYRALGSAVEMSGGSAANTMCGVSSLGGRAAYVGKVSRDDLGDVFGHDLLAVGVTFRPAERDNPVPTGRCIIVVTPDAQRTMNTFLGASSLLTSTDLDEETIADGQVLYMEGYLFDRDEAKAAFRTAASIAHAADRQVSLTLSDSFCVDRHRADFRDLVTDNVDILFGNEDELMSLYETDSFDEAIAAVRRECRLAAITVGARGSYIVSADETLHVPPVPVPRVVDTTGAGDLYAAGFLYGITQGVGLARAGLIGSVAAAEVISHVGPRPVVDLRTLLA